MTNLELVEAELAHAKRKHRRFVNQFRRPDPYTTIDRQLCGARELLAYTVRKRESDFADVLMCEVFEALHAYAHGDLAHARQELAQCAAVCIRGMEYIVAEIEKGGKK